MYPDEETLITERIIEIPIESIELSILRNLIEEFVSRDGTNYGNIESTLNEKVETVMMKLQQGEIKLFYDSFYKHTDILPADHLLSTKLYF